MRKFIMIFLLFGFSSCDPFPVVIKQRVEACNGEFKIITTVVYRLRIVYFHDTYNYRDNSCLSSNIVDSIKKAEYAKAETWVVTFNKIKD